MDSVVSVSRGDRGDVAHWRSLGALNIFGGLLSLLTLLAGVDATVHARAIVAIAGFALVFGVAVVLLADRLPNSLMPVGLLAAVSVVSATVIAGGEVDTPYALLYVWIGAECWYFLEPRVAALVTGTVLIANVLAFSIASKPGDAVGAWLVMITGTILVVTALAAALRGRSERLIIDLSRAASHDTLTALLNRRGFQQRIDDELEAAHRTNQPLAVIVGDLDRFKALNDTWGHRAGDHALTTFAALCQTHVRPSDVLARVGGEEFAIVLPGRDREGAVLIAERLRRAVSSSVASPGGKPITASFGVAAYPEHGRTAEALLDRADQAMYAAKTLGRNRSVVYCDELPNREDSIPHEGIQAVLVLAETLDLRDAGTSRHSQTVGRLCERTAMALGLPAARVERIRLAGILHDVGKLGVPDEILRKESALTDAEFAEMRRHAEVGARIVAAAGLDDIAGWVLAHHERVDGTGYPYRLRSERIPLEARILSVADAYEAMTADRPYRHSLGVEEAISELRYGAGSQFDTDVVAAFLAGIGAGHGRRSCLTAPVG